MPIDSGLEKLANFNQPTELRADLNRAVAALFGAKESHFRPHLSLNGEDGMAVLAKIVAADERANTTFYIQPLVDVDSGKLWLNLRFRIYLGEISRAATVVLTPRQTAWIVKECLSPDSRKMVLEFVKRWFFEGFRAEMEKSLEEISSQLVHGDPLVDDDFRGCVFDIHSRKSFPYTELFVFGEAVFWRMLYKQRGPMVMARLDAWEQVDQIFRGL